MMVKHGLCRLAITNGKGGILTKSKQYELATAKSTSTPYKMLKGMGGARSLPEIKKKVRKSILTLCHRSTCS